MKKMILNYIGTDSWSRSVYEDENGKLFKDVNCNNGTMELCTVYGGFDGEPDTPIKYIKRFKDVEIKIAKRYRTKQEMIKYFKQIAFEYERDAHRNDDPVAKGIAEAYELAAFEIEHNLE